MTHKEFTFNGTSPSLGWKVAKNSEGGPFGGPNDTEKWFLDPEGGVPR